MDEHAIVDMLQHADKSGKVNFQTFKRVMLKGLKASSQSPAIVVSSVAASVGAEKSVYPMHSARKKA